MTSLPLSVVLLPLALFLFIFLLFSAINLYHILRYGEHSTGKFTLIAFYVAGTLFLVGSSYLLLVPYNWNHPLLSEQDIPVEQLLPFFNPHPSDISPSL